MRVVRWLSASHGDESLVLGLQRCSFRGFHFVLLHRLLCFYCRPLLCLLLDFFVERHISIMPQQELDVANTMGQLALPSTVIHRLAFALHVNTSAELCEVNFPNPQRLVTPRGEMGFKAKPPQPSHSLAGSLFLPTHALRPSVLCPTLTSRSHSCRRAYWPCAARSLLAAMTLLCRRQFGCDSWVAGVV